MDTELEKEMIDLLKKYWGVVLPETVDMVGQKYNLSDVIGFAKFYNAQLRTAIAEARKVIEPLAETSIDDNYGGGNLWWTDYASGTRFEAFTGKATNRRPLNRSDLRAADEFLKKYPEEAKQEI